MCYIVVFYVFSVSEYLTVVNRRFKEHHSIQSDALSLLAKVGKDNFVMMKKGSVIKFVSRRQSIKYSYYDYLK